MADTKRKEESFSFPQSFDSDDFALEQFHESGGVIFRKTPSLEINTPSFFANDEEPITATPSSTATKTPSCDDVTFQDEGIETPQNNVKEEEKDTKTTKRGLVLQKKNYIAPGFFFSYKELES